MNNETTTFLNHLYPYFKMLDNINNDLTRVIKDNVKNNPFQNEELFYNITSELLRLFPYRYIDQNDSLILDKGSGILLFSSKIDFLEEKYSKILNFKNFHKVLKDIHKIRNKYIHEPHNISTAFSVGGTSMCSIGLLYKNELLSISTVSLAAVVYYLNIVFERIQKEAIELMDSFDEYKEYPYYEKFISFDFGRDRWHYTVLPEYLMFNY